METVIVTRHAGLLAYLVSEGIAPPDAPVITHATPEDVTGKHVIGVLPLNLACFAAKVTEIPITMPEEYRGRELTVDELRQFAGEPRTFHVREIVPGALPTWHHAEVRLVCDKDKRPIFLEIYEVDRRYNIGIRGLFEVSFQGSPLVFESAPIVVDKINVFGDPMKANTEIPKED